MSASEKLTLLQDAIEIETARYLEANEFLPWGVYRLDAKVARVLPQLRDVVQAAEEVIYDFDIVAGPIVTALDRLNEALEEE